MSRELKMCWKNQDGKGHFNTIYSSKILIDRNNLITGFLVQFRATGRRSNESIELQPLHLHKGPKGVLRRMPRVRSDEIHETNADPQPQPQPIPEKEKTPSPIGAGLPLLQRLRLLKEKQVSWIYNASSYFIYSLSNWIDFLCFLFRNFFHAITFGFHKNHTDWRRRIIFTKKSCTNFFRCCVHVQNENCVSTLFLEMANFKPLCFFFLLSKSNVPVLLHLHSSFNLHIGDGKMFRRKQVLHLL